jgi:hypothetical protein
MADFKNQGGVLSGREERYDGFQGEPRQIGGSLGNEASSMGAAGLEGRSTDATGTNLSGTGHGHHSHTTGTGSGLGRDTYDDNTTGTHKKPGLMDKLNPKKDADGDGKPGFMN